MPDIGHFKLKASNKTKTVYSNHPGHLLRRASQRCRQIHTEVCDDLEITTMQAAAIHILSDFGAMTQASLGKMIDMERSNVHGLVHRLKKKNLISVKMNKANGRAETIQLASKGKKLAEELGKRSRIVSEEFLSPLNKQEKEMLQECLKKLIASADVGNEAKN